MLRVGEAVDRDRAALGRVRPSSARMVGLARTVGADEAGDPAGGEGEGEVVDGGDVAVLLGQTRELDQCHGGRLLCCCRGLRGTSPTLGR